jgi:hypothetical protein
MGEIYRGAIVTIAALSSTTAHQPIFQHRHLLVHRLSDGSRLHISPNTCPTKGPDIRFNANYTDGMDKQNPLLRRAWAVQERFLSPRILGYSGEFCCWECIECKVVEHGVMSLLGDYEQDSLHKLLGVDPKMQTQSFSQPFLRAWHQFVTDFTACRLTYPTVQASCSLRHH